MMEVGAERTKREGDELVVEGEGGGKVTSERVNGEEKKEEDEEGKLSGEGEEKEGVGNSLAIPEWEVEFSEGGIGGGTEREEGRTTCRTEGEKSDKNDGTGVDGNWCGVRGCKEGSGSS